MSKVVDKVAQKPAMTRSDKVFLPRAFPFEQHVEDVKAEQLRTTVDEDGEEVCPWTEVVVETAGFVPLEVRMKQLEQNGLIARAVGGELSPDDMREAFLFSEFEISPDDEIEEVFNKKRRLDAFLAEIKARRQQEYEQTQSKNPPAFSPEEYNNIRAIISERFGGKNEGHQEKSDNADN